MPKHYLKLVWAVVFRVLFGLILMFGLLKEGLAGFGGDVANYQHGVGLLPKAFQTDTPVGYNPIGSDMAERWANEYSTEGLPVRVHALARIPKVLHDIGIEGVDNLRNLAYDAAQVFTGDKINSRVVDINKLVDQGVFTALAESSGGVNLVNPTSSARGYMQIMPETLDSVLDSSYIGNKAEAKIFSATNKTVDDIKRLTRPEKMRLLQNNPTLSMIVGLGKIIQAAAHNKTPEGLVQVGGGGSW